MEEIDDKMAQIVQLSQSLDNLEKELTFLRAENEQKDSQIDSLLKENRKLKLFPQ